MMQRIATVIKHPDKAYRQLYTLATWKARWKVRQILLSDYYYSLIREPKVRGSIKIDSQILEEVTKQLQRSDFDPVDYQIEKTDYTAWVSVAKYERFPLYCGGVHSSYLNAKKLQHYVAAKLLDLKKDDIYVDIGCGDSPAPEIYREMYGCQVYRQDVTYPMGIHGNEIGGRAENMPVPASSFTKMALHCSFEHFGGTSDMEFIDEASRVLKQEGRLCIVPLYLFHEYAILIDPCFWPRGFIRAENFESDAILYCGKDVIPYMRYYDATHLHSRIRNKLSDLKLIIYSLQNGSYVEPSCNTNFIALFDKVSSVDFRPNG